MTTNILIAGVGGQGTLLTSRILGCVYQNEGFDVKVSEIHGMSQRGGSVVTYVRYGESVASPLIEQGEADVILAFEQLEALRWLPYLKKTGKIISNIQKMEPMPVISGKATYPEGIEDTIRGMGADITMVDALSMATRAGNTKASNVVMIGCMARTTDIEKDKWIEAIKACVPPKFLEVNLKAFEAGWNCEI